ncbi:hypothetical protein RND81_14G215300 [Saponaria officinalis]|uniref:Uncharacterized protein n=1 Tax=Saponaria officinalis TaxID=3572 RepID=A0AAW1GPQ4_SAPOF
MLYHLNKSSNIITFKSNQIKQKTQLFQYILDKYIILIIMESHIQLRKRPIYSSISMPPIHLLAIFCIVILLLSISYHGDYKKAQIERNVQFGMLLFPFVAIFGVGFLLMNGGLYNFQLMSPLKKFAPESTVYQLMSPLKKFAPESTVYRSVASFPWRVVVAVVVLMVLLFWRG